MSFDDLQGNWPVRSNTMRLRSGPLAVLLIEDNPGDALLIEEMLSDAGPHRFALKIGDQLSQGLAIVAECDIDLILLDLSLPDSHGLDTVRRVRKAVPEIPVVVLTGSNDTELGIQAVNAGAQDYLAKDWVNHVILERSIMYALGRKQSEDHRLALAVEQERVRILANFVNDVSHEIRTPLSVIQLAAEGLEKFSALDARGCRRTQQIREQTFFINMLVDSMLALTKLDSGAQPEFVFLNVNELVQSVNFTVRSHADEKKLSLTLDLADNLPPVQANPDLVYTALYNLLDNAVHFTSEGGAVTVTTAASGAMVHVSIHDTGAGIKPDDLPHIFERFFRSDRARTGRRAGLGLPIALKIVELHQGQIEVDSTPGRGSTFRVLLPAATKAFA